jgi:hypothetical protein
VPLEQPGCEVARLLGKQPVAEVIGESPAALAEGTRDLGAQGGHEDIALLRLILQPHNLAQDRGYHVRTPL